ncbi:hypothetical protein QFX18_13480 [Saccharophagus degradans]|uniref:hypothetical protein n=1 Tax=Saccharophagus degradans TaxID=86304 RepID=UPI002477E241|nr:hypothetical protein [Saccharophagus degradans]WGO97055.1 hypothetical protein QFX18_13480 [Saccharophagus degradans]
MANIKDLSEKQNKKLKGKSDAEKALAAAKRAMVEARRFRNLKEPDQFASGKSGMNGEMLTQELTQDDDNEPKDN